MNENRIKTRSATAAQKIANERGLPEGTYAIFKLGTAKYELIISTEDPQEQVFAEQQEAEILAPIEVAEKPKPTKPVRVNRHWNDDGSLTLYVAGIKLRRIGGEDAENEDEIEDPEAFAETYLNKKFLKKNGGWVWGRTTQGHNWHTKRQKALRARILAGQEAGQDVSELEAELAKISGKGI